MHYGEAIGVLERSNEKFEFPVKWGVDLQSEHERYLTEKYAKKPVIVMNYPKTIKAFYMRVNDDGRTIADADRHALLLAGALISGGCRSVLEQFGEVLRCHHDELAAALLSRLGLRTSPCDAGNDPWFDCADSG